ncbi:MAG: hypothetical protein OES32_08045 [Acidobacteriota bacterium]|nr:hypothetical protein [Acidobacteriota bacterium]MDH3523525.1 hypothetical protein [Acidobacteriota bacterium]
MKAAAPVAAALALLLAAACREAADEAPPPARVENAALELAVARLPEPFLVAENAGSTLRFTTTHETGGTVEVTVGEPEYGLNLVAKVQKRRAAFEAAPGGEYKGSRELGTPFGPAYYARGLYDTESGRAEQTWIFALHPAGDSRLLTLIYTYPPGEEQIRVPELLGLVGELEAFVVAAPGDAPEPR